MHAVRGSSAIARGSAMPSRPHQIDVDGIGRQRARCTTCERVVPGLRGGRRRLSYGESVRRTF
jgi:hypothetical protein